VAESVVLFDGCCNLCNGAVLFIIRRDPKGRFAFASLQSRVGVKLLAERAGAGSLPDSVVLIDKDGLHVQSTAALRIARGLRFPWPMAYGFVVLPRVLRDWAYSWIARRRYKWFGRRDACMVPTAEVSARFVRASLSDDSNGND